MIHKYIAEVALGKKMAKIANDIAMSHFRTQLLFRAKADKSPVTIADENINRMVIEHVHADFPNDGVIGEEESWQETRKRLWICDPIDGTTAFSIGLPTFMFSVTLVDAGEPLISIASNPVSGDIFWAVKDFGAFRNNDRLHVSSRSLQDAWMLYPANIASLHKRYDLYSDLQQQAYQTIIIHGSVYKGTLVAQGFADGMIHLEKGNPWDFAAVDLLIREAGGHMTDATGNSLRFDTELTSVIASNNQIHVSLLDLASGYR